MRLKDNGHQIICALLLLAALAVVGWAYSPGLGGDFLFDDQPNLSGLAGLTDTRSKVEFVLSGSAGPLGRPIALATFLLNPHAWPDGASELIRTNILVHLLNGLLVAWLLLLLSRARGEDANRSAYAAVIGSALWSALPILASTSLMIIQRMTSLSSAFTLLGIIGYLLARRHLDERPEWALTGMSVSIVVFTVLAVFTKENGALLPVLVLVIESTLLVRPQTLKLSTWRVWKGVFLWLPLVIIVGVLAAQLPYPDTTVQMRGFNAWERLLTQSVVLWEYLFHAFLPLDTGEFGPFKQGHRIFSSVAEPAVLGALASWLFAIGLAIRYRCRAPIAAFALFWYLGAHLLESTVVPLELYFEHRNYLPLIGPVFGLAWLVVKTPARLAKFTAIATLGYFGLLTLTLTLVTSLWGQPFQAAKAQYQANPDSTRAVGFLFAHLYALGALEPAERLLDRAIENGLVVNRYRVSKLYLACRHGSNVFEPPNLISLENELAEGDFDKHLAHALYVLAKTRTESDCALMSTEAIKRLLNALLANSVYREHRDSLYWVHMAKGELMEASGNPAGATREFRQALNHGFNPTLLQRLVSSYLQEGEINNACQLVKKFQGRHPLNPVRRLYWHFTTERALDLIRETRPQSSKNSVCQAT